MPTITDESIAPEGCESFYVLSLVPHLDANINWDELHDTFSAFIADLGKHESGENAILQEAYTEDIGTKD